MNIHYYEYLHIGGGGRKGHFSKGIPMFSICHIVRLYASFLPSQHCATSNSDFLGRDSLGRHRRRTRATKHWGGIAAHCDRNGASEPRIVQSLP